MTSPVIYDPEDPIHILEERHVITIILMLKREGPCKKTDIYFRISMNTRMCIKLDRMVAAGLITITITSEGRRAVVELTPYGMRVAVALEYLESVMKTRPPEEVEEFYRRKNEKI